MWVDGKRAREGIFRPMQFLCDTFTAKDLKSDNTRTHRTAPRRVTAILGSHRRAVMPRRRPSSAAPRIIRQPTLWGTLPCLADVWIINHISYQRPIPRHVHSFPKLKAMHVKYSSSYSNFPQSIIQRNKLVKEFKCVFLKNHSNPGFLFFQLKYLHPCVSVLPAEKSENTLMKGACQRH